MRERFIFSYHVYNTHIGIYIYTKVSGRPRCRRYRTFYRRAWCIVCRPLNARFFYPFQPSNAKEIILCIIFFGPFFCRVSFRPLYGLPRTRPSDNNIIITRSLFLRHFSHMKIDSHKFSFPSPWLRIALTVSRSCACSGMKKTRIKCMTCKYKHILN